MLEQATLLACTAMRAKERCWYAWL